MSNARTLGQSHDLALSFLAVRQSLGYLGLALPIVLLSGALLLQNGIPASISHFYYTPLSDIFVGILCAIGVFLFAYKAYDTAPKSTWFSHKLVARIAGIGAIGLALVPTYANGPIVGCAPVHCLLGEKLGSNIHHIFAGMFFVSLTLFCLMLFVEKSPNGNLSPAQSRRNLTYRICGIILFSTLVLLFSYRQASLEIKALLDSYSYQFWIESIGVWAFGISWLVNGRAFWFLNDMDQNTPPVEPSPTLNLIRKLMEKPASNPAGKLAVKKPSVVVDIPVPEFNLPLAYSHDLAQHQPGHKRQYGKDHQSAWKRSGQPYGYRPADPHTKTGQRSPDRKSYENISWGKDFQNREHEGSRDPHPPLRPH